VYISRVTEGGPAAIDGKLAVGDRIVSVRALRILLSTEIKLKLHRK